MLIPYHRFAWLVAESHNNKSSAISNIRIDYQDKEDPGRQDLGAGTGGKIHYLAWRTDGEKKITDVQLLRRQRPVSWDTLRGLGFEVMTDDINAGRGGDFLQMAWKY
jgi:hypothetical protein